MLAGADETFQPETVTHNATSVRNYRFVTTLSAVPA